MSDRRIVVEHKDGRRISVIEADFDRDDANPFNHRATIHQFDANTGETVMTERPAKPMDDWQSLRKEGFKAVMAIDPDTGNEVPLK